MSIEEIEAHFEKKTQAYNQLIEANRTRQDVMRSMTLRLICKHAYPKPQYPNEVMESSESESDDFDKEAFVIE